MLSTPCLARLFVLHPKKLFWNRFDQNTQILCIFKLMCVLQIQYKQAQHLLNFTVTGVLTKLFRSYCAVPAFQEPFNCMPTSCNILVNHGTLILKWLLYHEQCSSVAYVGCSAPIRSAYLIFSSVSFNITCIISIASPVLYRATVYIESEDVCNFLIHFIQAIHATRKFSLVVCGMFNINKTWSTSKRRSGLK